MIRITFYFILIISHNWLKQYLSTITRDIQLTLGMLKHINWHARKCLQRKESMMRIVMVPSLTLDQLMYVIYRLQRGQRAGVWMFQAHEEQRAQLTPERPRKTRGTVTILGRSKWVRSLTAPQINTPKNTEPRASFQSWLSGCRDPESWEEMLCLSPSNVMACKNSNYEKISK